MIYAFTFYQVYEVFMITNIEDDLCMYFLLGVFCTNCS